MFKASLLVIGFLLGSMAEAAPLDLGSLAQFDYQGRDELNGRSTCRLVVSPIRQDFGGRMVQDYRFWTEGQSNLNFNLRLKGPNRHRDGRDLGNGRSEYTITIDAVELLVVGDTANPANLHEFVVKDISGVSGNSTTMMKCMDVRGTPRQ